MATILDKVVAGFSDQLEPGEQFRLATKARVPSLLGAVGLGTPVVHGVKVPNTMVWAVTDTRLFMWSNDMVTGRTPKRLVLVLTLGTDVEIIAVGRPTRDLPLALLIGDRRLDVTLPVGNGTGMAEFLWAAAPPSWVTPIDRYHGDARGAELAAAFRGSDWESAERILDLVGAGYARDELIGNVPIMVPGRPPGFDAWVTARPASATAHLVRGAHAVAWAWEARGTGYADTVDRDAWQVFHGRLDSAEADLARACELDPTDATPWTVLLHSGRGLSVGKEELLRRFGEAVDRLPDAPTAHFSLLQGLCAKWVGSNDEMFGFARTRAGSAPDGSVLHGLIPDAHVEHWLEASRDKAVAGYFQEPAVRVELIQHAQRSVLHPSWVDQPWGVRTLNLFAATLRLAGERELSQEVAVRIGTRRTEVPWCYFEDADGMFRRAQDGAGPG